MKAAAVVAVIVVASLAGGMLLLTLLLFFGMFFPYLPEGGYRLASGWLRFPAEVLPKVAWEPAGIASGMGFLLLAYVGLHLLARACARKLDRTWDWGASARLMALFVLLFGLLLAGHGISQQTSAFLSGEKMETRRYR